MKKSNLLLLASLMALTVATAATAQTTPAAAPAAPAPPTPPTFGAAIPGQCVLDQQTAMATSKMGVGAATRLGQLKAAVDADLQQQAQSLETEYNQLVAAKGAAKTPADQKNLESKGAAWGKKRDAFQAKVQQRQQEMQYTQQEVMSAIFSKMVPNINSVVTAKGCSTVVDAASLVHYDTTTNTGGQPTQTTFTYVNPAMDITSAVVQKMDSTGELLPPFDRVSLDQPAGQQAAAPKPAAPKPAAGAAPKK